MIEHISTIVARVTADMADRQVRHLDHDLRCPYWERIEPTACACTSRPVVDLLLALAKAA